MPVAHRNVPHQQTCESRECAGMASTFGTLAAMGAGAAIVAFDQTGALVEVGLLLGLLCGYRAVH
jgi:hypothetical protein